MSLSARITLAIIAVVAVFVSLDQVIQRTFATRTFARLERDAAIDRHLRARARIERASADRAAVAIARWADIASGRRDDLGGSGLDLLYVLNELGEVEYRRIEDPGTGEEIELRRFPRRGLLDGHPLIAAGQDRGTGTVEPIVGGLMETERGLLIACSLDIAGPRRQGGRLIAGSFLTERRLDALMTGLDATIEIWPLGAAPESEVDAETGDRMAAFPTELVARQRGDTYEVLGTLTTVLEVPSLLMRSRRPNDLMAVGLRNVHFSLLSTGFVALAILLVLTILLRRIVVRPLDRLTRYALVVAQSENPDEPLAMERSDEIGVLATELQRMLRKLAQSRSEAAHTARLAGMSEIAIGVLHNVGNALNSVGISTEQVRKRLGKVPSGELGRINDALDRHTDDLEEFLLRDPRGRALPELLKEIERSVDENLEAARGELEGVEAGVERMRQLVAVQQKNARQDCGTRLPVVLSEEAEAALEVCQKAAAGNQRIEVLRTYEDLPATMVDRYKLREILINLVRNAQQALGRSPKPDKRLHVAVCRADEHFLQVEVEDNGVGISEEDLTRIFALGFTTREDGHGFGLHSASNSAKELGGDLVVQSAGVGQGARFTLTVPFRAVEEHAPSTPIHEGPTGRTRPSSMTSANRAAS